MKLQAALIWAEPLLAITALTEIPPVYGALNKVHYRTEETNVSVDSITVASGK